MLLTALAMAAGVLIGLGLPALLFAPLSLVGGLVIGATISIAELCAALPLAKSRSAQPLNLVAALACAAAIAWFAPTAARPSPAARQRTKHRPAGPRDALVFAAAVVGLAVVLIAANGTRPDGRLHMTVLDVGQGDAIYIQGPRGGRALIDTGPDPNRLIALLDQRIPSWDRRLDLVVITHPHEDHIAGMAALMDRYRIGEIVEPGMIGPGPGDAAFRERLAETGRQSRIIAAGDHLTLDGIQMDALWPLPGTVPLRPPDSGTAINNVSIVLDVHFGARRIVLAGDVEQQIDPQLLAAGIAADGRAAGRAEGRSSRQRDGDDRRVRGADASERGCRQRGLGNPYGHPSPKTVARLQATRRARSFARTSTARSTSARTARIWSRTPAAADPSRRRHHPRPHRASASARSRARRRARLGGGGAEPTIAAMTIPTREEAATILRSLNPPEWHLEHSAAVADVAAFLAQKIAGAGPRDQHRPGRGRGAAA